MKCMQFKIALLILPFLLTGCARQQGTTSNEKGLPSAGNVEGKLTVNGRPEVLKYVYSQRVGATPEGRQASLNILLSNQALAEEKIEQLFQDAENWFLNVDEILKDSSIHALFLTIPKNQPYKAEKIDCDVSLLTPKHSLRQSDSTAFEEFDLKKGVIKAKASGEWEGTNLDDKFTEVKITCSYSVDFQTTLKESSGQNQSAETVNAQAPAEGKADGKMSYEGETVALKFAYAKRFKLFFDEPEEFIVVALTDKAIPEASRLEILEKTAASTAAINFRASSWASISSAIFTEGWWSQNRIHFRPTISCPDNALWRMAESKATSAMTRNRE